jgi:hypothetical protein
MQIGGERVKLDPNDGTWVTGPALEVMRAVGPNADNIPLVGGVFREGDELLIDNHPEEPAFVGVLVVRATMPGGQLALRVAHGTESRKEYWFWWNYAVGWRRPNKEVKHG